MRVRLTTVEHFDSLDEVERAKDILEDAGLQPIVVDEARLDSEGVFALQVPEEQAERAEELLDSAMRPEEEEAMETLTEWESESDELRESYERY